MEESIRVILCEPGQPAKVVEIENEITKLQDLVRGNLECIDCSQYLIVCNKEGIFDGSRPNRMIKSDGKATDSFICGSFFVCDCNEEGDFISLTDAQVTKAMSEYEHAETFMAVNGKIISVPVARSKVSPIGDIEIRKEGIAK